MEWTKLNKKEVIYYCKSFEVDFSCSPFSLQLEELVLMFHYYGIEQFTVKDIQDFYQKMQIPKPNTFEIVPAEKGHFLPFDTSIYSDEIEKGYQAGIARSRIEGYYEKYCNNLNF